MAKRGRHALVLGCETAVAFSALALGLAAPGSAWPEAAGARGPRAVVELFTSQGCPKCPPADRLITELARSPDTIALSFAVGIWDYIGWKDTLAEPAFSVRQRAYAAARGDQLIFTPQAIIDGVDVEAGADRTAILKDIGALPGEQRAMSVPMTLTESNGDLHVEIGPAERETAPRQAGVYVLRVARQQTVEIDRGENSGRSVTYTNAVRAMNRVGTWSGGSLHFDVLELKADGEGYVVLVQAGTPDKPGAILAAAKSPGL